MRKPAKKQEGIALLMAITTIAILGVMVADMHESTGTAFAVSTAQRDALQAEYLAKSSVNLTRLFIQKEPEMRRIVDPIYRALMNNRPAPQLPVWKFANDLLSPFCAQYDEEDEEGRAPQMGSIDFTNAQGLEDLPGTCQVIAVAENGKINVNDPLFQQGDRARLGIAQQFFALMGGYQSPSVFDPLFSGLDANGQITTRLDVVSAVIDWWDEDTLRTDFDSGAGEIKNVGGEDDHWYQRLDDSYPVKNAPFDSLEELRLVRGVDDDFWATFVEPLPNDPEARILTVYAAGSVNINEAPAVVLLARLCSLVEDATLCTDVLEAGRFTQVLETARLMVPLPLFGRAVDFVNFVEGKRGSLYETIQSFLGEESDLLFVPITIPSEQRSRVTRSLLTSAQIMTIQATGFVGRSHVTLNTVLNFHARWSPPPPNAGRMSGLGVVQYYRVD